ncbi:uncharacterized protein BDZ99DRAFT_480874 [Mytilinidion resinicola]|uniref:BHLH domain-containing protein n=1 Tax=Mytilinidion resinicola TaxID=574789 RepID=A0A6A6Y9S1_9PEZI|nr:uncharacterized protein BDZ99DRAFT_480874 [Mytilinidion resinicola]KAF2804865.1 hypothetical protein BDZ99DRAFT_480874 [Mytilinidion resinicola]
MPVASDAINTYHSYNWPTKTTKRDLRLGNPSDEPYSFSNRINMTGNGSPQPFIKEEFDDMRFMGHNGLDMQPQFPGQQFGNSHDNIAAAVNPSDLTMSGSFSIGQQYGTSNMSSSYLQGNAGIPDDELADLVGPSGFNDYGNQDNVGQNQGSYYPATSNGGVSMSHPNMQIYSHTPDDQPIQSPFMQNNFDFSQYQSAPQRVAFQQGMPTPNMQNGSLDINARARAKMPGGMSRNGSDTRSPMSPKTPVLGGLHLGTPDSGSFPSQPIMANAMSHRHQKSISGQWDNTPSSAHSWIDSPNQSPHTGSLHHQQISEVLGTGKHASLPTKVDIGQSQDAKKRRRRESHNLVERRRRDNINERIHDLSRLVPAHRLDDEKVRKHISNNGPLSPSLTATGMSPPHATSLLAGGSGRRAAGNITQGLPIEEKDKGPNKGDILNGAVSWTRDLMWFLYKKIQETDEMSAQLKQLTGQEWPTDETEEERRMRTELVDAVEKNGTSTFKYSRGPGSGLRVPKHTNIAGEPIHQISPQSLSPGMQSGGSGHNSGGNGDQFWMNHQGGSSGGSFSLKEEDEYNGMEMG